MRTALPPNTDQTDALKPRLPREHDGQTKPRLQRLSLLASGQAHTCQDVAYLLGLHRQTLGRWWVIYAAGGLDAWLATDVPAGQPVSRALAVLASLEQALHGREGCASYEARRQGVRQTHGVAVKAKTLYGIVRTRFRAKLTVPRPSHTPKAGGHPGVPGPLSGAPAARQPSRQPPPRPGVEPRRKPVRRADGAPPSMNGLGRSTRGAPPTRLRMV